MDVLSDALRVIRLKGALFLNAEFREPWCVKAPRGVELGRNHGLPGHQVAVCHLVIEGRCWLQLPGAEPLEMAAGDVVALPQGDPHILGSGLRGGPVSAGDAVHVRLPELTRQSYGGSGAATVVVCGWFAYERHVRIPVMAAFPRAFRASIRNRPSGAWLENSIRYAVEESASGRPGSEALADKLAEILFLESLRAHIETLPERETGWLAGLRDPVVGRGIAAMHEAPAQAWTVASLARAAGTSRTVLAERFAALMGMPPMQYLMQWRIALAAHLLRDDDEPSLARVAERIGYDSEAAFSRAFKRQYGVPPGTWRRRNAKTASGADFSV
jgi:AraC family transcriptional regulator, alkane utilization regulator